MSTDAQKHRKGGDNGSVKPDLASVRSEKDSAGKKKKKKYEKSSDQRVTVIFHLLFTTEEEGEGGLHYSQVLVNVK